MRIINILAHDQHYSYASPTKGGKMLKPGETTGILPFERLLDTQVWKDIRSNKIVIRLDPSDVDIIKNITAEDAKPIVVASMPVKPKPVPKPVKKAPKLIPQSTRVKDAVLVMYPQAKGKPGSPSLDDLRRENAGKGITPVPSQGKSSKGEISTFMKDMV